MELFLAIMTQSIPALTLEILLLCIVAARFRSFFWGRLLLVSISINIVMAIYYALVFDIFRAFEFHQTWIALPTALTRLSLVLLALAIAALPASSSVPYGRHAPLQASDLSQGRLRYTARHPGWTLFFIVITGNIYWVIWLYKTVKELNQLSRFRFTPGKAVGFLFIPVFNLGWFPYVIISISRAIKNIRGRLPPEKNIGFSMAILPTLAILGFFLNATSGLAFSSKGSAWKEYFQFLLLGEITFALGFFYAQRYVRHIWVTVAHIIRQAPMETESEHMSITAPLPPTIPPEGNTDQVG